MLLYIFIYYILFIKRQEKRTQHLRHVPLVNEDCDDLTFKLYYHIERAFFYYFYFIFFLFVVYFCVVVAKLSRKLATVLMYR